MSVHSFCKPFFVMLNNMSGTLLVPLMNGEDLAMFENYEQAKIAAEENPMGDAYGYQIFESGDGVGI